MVTTAAMAVLASSARRKSAGDGYLERRDPPTSRSLLIAAAMPRAALSPAAATRRPSPIDSQPGLSPPPTISRGIVMINQSDSLRARIAFAVTRMSLPAIFHTISAAFCQTM
jgi:hypothetical protein